MYGTESEVEEEDFRVISISRVPMLGNGGYDRVMWAAYLEGERVAFFERRSGVWSVFGISYNWFVADYGYAGMGADYTCLFVRDPGMMNRLGEQSVTVDCTDGQGPDAGGGRHWSAIMVADVDGDDIPEVFAQERVHPGICLFCEATFVYGLYYWDGTELKRGMETLAVGSGSDSVVEANNRAVELGRAGRWMEALTVVDRVERVQPVGNAVFRRNASVIRLNGSRQPYYYECLEGVLAGDWRSTVDTLREMNDVDLSPLENDLLELYEIREIYDRTSEARTVAPAVAELEYLHAWAAYNIDPDHADVVEEDFGGFDLAENLVDSDDAVVLEALRRAVELAPNDELFVAALRAIE